MLKDDLNPSQMFYFLFVFLPRLMSPRWFSPWFVLAAALTKIKPLPSPTSSFSLLQSLPHLSVSSHLLFFPPPVSFCHLSSFIYLLMCPWFPSSSVRSPPSGSFPAFSQQQLVDLSITRKLIRVIDYSFNHFESKSTNCSLTTVSLIFCSSLSFGLFERQNKTSHMN